MPPPKLRELGTVEPLLEVAERFWNHLLFFRFSTIHLLQFPNWYGFARFRFRRVVETRNIHSVRGGLTHLQVLPEGPYFINKR